MPAISDNEVPARSRAATTSGRRPVKPAELTRKHRPLGLAHSGGVYPLKEGEGLYTYTHWEFPHGGRRFEVDDRDAA